MIRWRQRLAVRAALAAAGGGILGAGVGWLLGIAWPAELVSVTAALSVIGGASGAAWWANRQARTLRGVVDQASSALSGRSLRIPAHEQANESAIVVHAVHALVEHAERNTRELSQRQAYAAVGDFAAELARELAPSVANARNAMRAIEANLHIDSPLQPPLARAQRELHRLSNTLQDTLRLARSGQLPSRQLDLWMPLRSALKTVADEAQNRRVLLKPPPHGRPQIWIHGDPDALEQLFLNLLINAVQATEANGHVEVDVMLAEDATVVIADTGCGIPEGALDRVFEPFYTTKAERAGLGLAIAWRTAAAHGGKLSIESALGRGTTVRVALPLSSAGGDYTLSGAVSTA